MLVDGEVVLVVVLVHRELRAGGERAVGGVGLPAGAHDDLPEVLEVSGMERQILQICRRIGLHTAVISAEKERVHRPVSGERLVRRTLAQRRGEAHGGGVRVAEEVDVLRHVLVEAADGERVVRVLVVAEPAVERHVRVGFVRDPRPVDPVREEGEAGVGRGEVLAGGGEPGMEEVEVRPRVRAHAVAGHGGGERAVVARAVVAELHHLKREVVAAAQLVAREVVAEAVAVRGEAGIPQEAPHAVEAALDVAHVAADDRGLVLARLHVFHVLHERHDDRLALVGRKALPDPVVGAEREDARGGVPVDRTPVGVSGMVGGHARHEHLARLLQILLLAREAPGERTFGRLRSPFLHARDRRGGGGLVRAARGLHLAEHHGVEAGADGVFGIFVAALEERVARGLGRPFRPRLHLLPRLGVEEHARMPCPNLLHPRVVRHRRHRDQASTSEHRSFHHHVPSRNSRSSITSTPRARVRA